MLSVEQLSPWFELQGLRGFNENFTLKTPFFITLSGLLYLAVVPFHHV